MKKLILSMLIVFFNSCSPEEQEKIDALKINPPSWIQGTWDAKDEGTNIIGLKFTSNSFIKIEEDGTESNVMLAYAILQGLGTDVTIEEFKSNSTYAIKASTVSSVVWYRFTKIASTEISWDNSPPLNKAKVYLKKK